MIEAMTHRLLPPVLFFCVCAATLAAVSHSMWVPLTPGGETTSTRTPTKYATFSSVRAYLVPQIQVAFLSADTLTVTIVVSGSGTGTGAGAASLLEDVQSGLINVLLIGGTTWAVVLGPSGSLVLQSYTVPTSPVKVVTAGLPTWTTVWGSSGSGAGALVIAFKDPSIATP